MHKKARQYRTIGVYELRSKLFRQVVQKFCRLANASQESFAQHGGNRFKQGVHSNLRGVAFKASISVFLVLAICFVSCTSVFAASSKERYISELILCSAASADEAEAKLKDQGYKLLVSDNLNENLSEGMYLGYKSTANPSEAITNISAMNMQGKYSFSDYEILMEKMKENVSATIDGLIPMITSYRNNYKAGAVIATEVYTILNKFYEDDSGKKMGDYLLTCDLSDTTDITKVFMQGCSSFIVDIQQLLFLAGESESDQAWIEKMASSDPDYLLDTYLKSYPTPNKAFSAIAAKYGDTADSIRSTWDNFYENLNKIKEKYFTEKDGKLEFNESYLSEKITETVNANKTEITDDMTSDQLDEQLNNTAAEAELYDNISDMKLISYLDSLEYDGGTMLTFFMRSSDDVDDEELYTLAYYMGTSLAAQVNNVGLQQVISRTLLDGDTASKTSFDSINKTLESFETISIYDGVDRSLFENGVALTGATVEKSVSSGKSWSDGLFSRIFQPSGEYKWADYFAFYVAPMFASAIFWFCSHIVNATMDQAIINMMESASVELPNQAAKLVSNVSLIHNAPVYERTSGALAFMLFGKGSLSQGTVAFRIVQGFKVFFFVLSAVFAVLSIVYLFVTIFADDDGTVEYTSIPNHIVDTISTENGDDYIAYDTVKNLSGSAGDLYNFTGKNGWFVLYSTKDTSAGAPITTDVKIVKGSTRAPLDHENMTMFGEKNAVNLTSKDYTGVNDKANGTYMYFNRGEVSTVASAFTQGGFAISIGIGAVAGVLLGIVLQKKPKKKKNNPALA